MSDDKFQDDHVDFEDAPDGAGFGDFEGGGTTLGDMWRNNPLVKIGVIAGGLITIIGAIILFGGTKNPLLESRVGRGDAISEAPGSGTVSDEYKKAVEESNVQRTEEAVRTAGSAIPTPVDTAVQRLKLPEENLAAEDPLDRWRRIQEERQRQSTQKPQIETANPYAEAIDNLSAAMAGQMEGILATKTARDPVYMLVTDPNYLQKQRDDAQKKAADAQTADAAKVTGDGDVVNILIPAGTVEYAQLITEANSDTEGPILAQLVSGPLAGAKLLGTFTTEDEFLVLNFSAIVIDGISHPTEAIALNPDTTSPGMVTDIDHRYFSRIVLPAAASFVTGLGEGIVQVNETTVNAGSGTTISSKSELDPTQELFSGIKEASSAIGDILTEDGKETEPLIRVQSGTPMGLLFVQPVTDETQQYRGNYSHGQR